jgi:hypothetical protein
MNSTIQRKVSARDQTCKSQYSIAPRRTAFGTTAIAFVLIAIIAAMAIGITLLIPQSTNYVL